MKFIAPSSYFIHRPTRNSTAMRFNTLRSTYTDRKVRCSSFTVTLSIKYQIKIRIFPRLYLVHNLHPNLHTNQTEAVNMHFHIKVCYYNVSSLSPPHCMGGLWVLSVKFRLWKSNSSLQIPRVESKVNGRVKSTKRWTHEKSAQQWPW